MVSPLQNAIIFFKDFGLFDVVLPFLLVFAIVFAILEKTMILGTEGKGDGVKPKKNLNSMVAFVVAMLVVAANKIVSAINEALPNIVFIIVIFVAFLMMIGVFFKTGEMDLMETHPWAVTGFVVFSLIAIILIVLDSIKIDKTTSWLDYIITYSFSNISGPVVTSVIFLVIAIAAIVFITKGAGGKTGKTPE